jgi:hypothetical protein
MKRLNLAAILSSLGILVFALSCAAPLSLVSMSVTPSNATAVGIGNMVPVQYSAYGTFIHPNKVVDLTKEVTWTSSIPAVGVVSSTGVVTAGGSTCGVTIITATAGKSVIGPGNNNEVVVAMATFTVADPSVSGCPTQ